MQPDPARGFENRILDPRPHQVETAGASARDDLVLEPTVASASLGPTAAVGIAAAGATSTTTELPSVPNSASRGVLEGGQGRAAVAPATMSSLSDEVLNMTLAFLDSETLMKCQSACRLMGKAAQREELWQTRCVEDWGVTCCVRPERRSESFPTYVDTWRGWRKAFSGYDAAAVKRVGMFWAGIEAWMAEHLPEVLGTLNVGVSEAELDRAEEMLEWNLPTDLRLLYRFRNGQWLPWDERLNISLGMDEERPPGLSQIIGSGMSFGILGGYSFYNHMTTSKLFSLQRGVLAGLATADAFSGENHEYFHANAIRWGTDLKTIRERGGFLLAASHDMSKRIWVGSDGNVRHDGKAAGLMGVFDAAPVVPPSRSQNASSGGNDDPEEPARQGNLLTWLEEYLRRLQDGYYGVRTRWLETYNDPGFVGGSVATRASPGVWLFPQRAGRGGCVTQVTKGVEIRVSPIFVAEACSDRTDRMWAYSVRMQLLCDHPSRPQSMRSCQLSTRHWEIDGTEGFHREISGDGVIGEYPLLSIPAVAPAPEGPAAAAPRGGGGNVFEYESCTTLEKHPGTMSGSFSFKPGGLSSPTGPPFNARVPPFELVDPDFIF